MPYDAQDGRYPHLKLVAEDRSPDRRKRPAPPSPPPNRGGRSSFARQLDTRLTELEQEIASAAVASPGIQPHLVFRIPLAKGAMVDEISKDLRSVGLIPVSIEPDRAVIAFRTEMDLTEFKAAVQTYRQGPRVNPRTGELRKSTRWDKLEYIDPDSMMLWSRRERIGTRLKQDIGEAGTDTVPATRYTVDVELWHRGTRELAASSVQEVENLIGQMTEGEHGVLDRYIGDDICLLRLAVSGDVLSRLLDLTVVAEVEYPPQPQFDPIAAAQVTPRDFPTPVRPAPNGPRVCVVDSGTTTRHPLLENNIGSAAAFMSTTTIPEDEHGHGTMVSGLAAFGSVRACYESGSFSSPVTIFSARVLNRGNRFDDERLIVNQMREAITTFREQPHNCRVFNLSLGSGDSAFVDGGERQTIWAESLDVLARELKVLLVVSAGNFAEVFTRDRAAAEQVLSQYPQYLLDEQVRLSDPATAAIPLTVGAISEHDVVARGRGIGANDITRAIAGRNKPAPFTRVGHGINGAIKPEFIDYGGNAVFGGTGSNYRFVGRDQGLDVMSFSNRPLQRLFAYDVGTSFAAPLVARNAALLWDRLRATFGSEPHPNLVRAVMASAANVPAEVSAAFPNQDDCLRVAGYGRIDPDFAFASSNKRVTLVAEGSLTLDRFAVYSVPIPQSFVDARGRKSIRVALAFDPPVRRRRMDYLGVQMTFQMIRGKTLDEVIDAYRSVDPDEEPERAIQGSCKIDFEPKESSRIGGYKRKLSTLQRADASFTRIGARYSDTYWLVVRSERKWAPVEIETQDYAIAVVLAAEDAQLYNNISLRLQQRTRIRTRR